MLMKSLTLNAPLNHNGSETQPNPVRAEQVNIYEEYKKLTLYIPENFDIDKLVKISPPDFKYHRDCFIYLVHLIIDIPSRNKDSEMDYIPFYSALIQRRVRNYRDYLNYLVKQGVFLENKQYIVGKQSRSFKFTAEYDTIIKPVFITKRTLIKSILNFINIDISPFNLGITTNEESLLGNKKQELEYLLKWFNKDLTIDYLGAKEYLEDLYELESTGYITKAIAMRKFNSRYIVLLKLHRMEFSSTIDCTAGRLHTVLTQLKGELRQFIRFNGRSLIAVDITNSQPYLSTVLLNLEKYRENNILPLIQIYNKSYTNPNTYKSQPYYLSKKIENAKDSANVKTYIEYVKSGQLYEEFGKILLENGIITDENSMRKQAKNIIFSSIFSPNQCISYNEAMQIFKGNFPEVYEIYRAIKQSEHRTLACILQNLEAQLILHTACKIISEEKPEIPLFTLHDSIITTEGNEEYVYGILFEILLYAIGIPPTLKFEKWEKVA